MPSGLTFASNNTSQGVLFFLCVEFRVEKVSFELEKASFKLKKQVSSWNKRAMMALYRSPENHSTQGEYELIRGTFL